MTIGLGLATEPLLRHSAGGESGQGRDRARSRKRDVANRRDETSFGAGDEYSTVGTQQVEPLLATRPCREAPPGPVQPSMVEPAQRHQVVEVGGTALRPVDNVMAVEEPPRVAARELAEPVVALLHLPA